MPMLSLIETIYQAQVTE